MAGDLAVFQTAVFFLNYSDLSKTWQSGMLYDL